MNMMWPILIVVTANTLYHMIAKSTPDGVQPFASLTITYLTAAITSVVFFLFTSQNKNLIVEVQKATWTSFAFGFVVVALEFGYICVYRAGWKISTGSLIANISLACVLLLVGVMFYKEAISIRQILGMVLCVSGLTLICR